MKLIVAREVVNVATKELSQSGKRRLLEMLILLPNKDLGYLLIPTTSCAAGALS